MQRLLKTRAKRRFLQGGVTGVECRINVGGLSSGPFWLWSECGRRVYAMCSLFVDHVNGRALVRITGEVDIASSWRLEEAFDLLDGPLDVDCSQLDFIDAAGLGVLARAVASHGSVVLRNPPALLVRMLEITSLDQVLKVEVTRAPAA